MRKLPPRAFDIKPVHILERSNRFTLCSTRMWHLLDQPEKFAVRLPSVIVEVTDNLVSDPFDRLDEHHDGDGQRQTEHDSC